MATVGPCRCWRRQATCHFDKVFGLRYLESVLVSARLTYTHPATLQWLVASPADAIQAKQLVASPEDAIRARLLVVSPEDAIRDEPWDSMQNQPLALR